MKSKGEIEEIRIENRNAGFEPSYMKKNVEAKEKEKRKIPKKMIIWMGARLLIVLVISFAILMITNHFKYKEYRQFEQTMLSYGFDKIYDNGSANTGDKVTKSEAIKMVISALYNTSNIEGITTKPEKEYSNAIWVEYAQKLGIITETDVNENNADESATYSEVIRYFSNAKSKTLGLELDVEDHGNIKDINQYNMDEKFAILDMVNSKIITIHPEKLKARKKVFKGQVNELIKNFVETYNTITLEGEKLNINEEKKPSNADQYPYTVISVNKEVYEYDFAKEDEATFRSPLEVFPTQKEYFYQIRNNTENYYRYLVNIDYTTITEEKFKKDIKKYLLYDVEDETVHQYVKYVKDNRIKLTGDANVQIPIIYYDGSYYRVRVKITFKVESSLTNENLLYRDLVEGKTKKYSDKEYTIYMDTYMANVMNNKTLYHAERSFYEMLVDPKNSKIELAGE